MTNTPVDLYEQAVDKLERWQLDEAEELLRQLLDADPEHAKAVNKLGVFYARREQLDAAEELFQAIALTPMTLPLSNLGNIYAQQNGMTVPRRHEKALALIQTIPMPFTILVYYTAGREIGKSVELIMGQPHGTDADAERARSSPQASGCRLGLALFIVIVLLIAFTLVETHRLSTGPWM